MLMTTAFWLLTPMQKQTKTNNNVHWAQAGEEK